MALIVDYTSLSQAILDFSHRSDLQGYVDYFIQSAQEKINDDVFSRNIGNGIRLMEAQVSGAINATTGTFPVPSDWIAPKFMTVFDIDGDQSTLIFKDPPWIYDNYPVRQPTDVPAYIARDSSSGTNVFIFGPFPDSAYNVQGTYYSQAQALSNTDTTNWMVLARPLMLHAACMMAAQPFLKDDMSVWEGIYDKQMQAMIDQDKAERFAGQTLQVEVG